jgi:hypothetical protein
MWLLRRGESRTSFIVNTFWASRQRHWTTDSIALT